MPGPRQERIFHEQRMLEKGKEKITRSPLRFSKKDQSSVTTYQRSLQASQRQKRREGKRGITPCRTPPGQRSPRRGTAAAPPQERCVREEAASHRNAVDAPHRPPPARALRQLGTGPACGCGQARTRSAQGPSALSCALPTAAGGAARRG